MRKSVVGMRSAQRDLSTPWPLLGLYCSTISESYSRLKMFRGGKKHCQIPKNNFVICISNICSCFSFTINVMQGPVTYLYAAVVDY